MSLFDEFSSKGGSQVIGLGFIGIGIRLNACIEASIAPEAFDLNSNFTTRSFKEP